MGREGGGVGMVVRFACEAMRDWSGRNEEGTKVVVVRDGGGVGRVAEVVGPRILAAARRQ